LDLTELLQKWLPLVELKVLSNSWCYLDFGRLKRNEMRVLIAKVTNYLRRKARCSSPRSDPVRWWGTTVLQFEASDQDFGSNWPRPEYFGQESSNPGNYIIKQYRYAQNPPNSVQKSENNRQT